MNRESNQHRTSVSFYKTRLSGVLLFSFLFTVFTRVEVIQANRLAQKSLTPVQRETEKQERRLESPETEERRDAVTRLGSMRNPTASRAAVPALKDPVAIVRATAAAAILSLPREEAAASLIPLLSDKDEFVRREAAYALGQTRSQMALASLIDRLLTDKKAEVRGAAAVALGQISNAGAVAPLASALNPELSAAPSKKSKKNKREQNTFVLRSAARSLGQIGDRAAVPVLVATLQDEKVEDDVRRESAFALGAIADPIALPALREVVTRRDPYLAEAAHDAIQKIKNSPDSNP